MHVPTGNLVSTNFIKTLAAAEQAEYVEITGSPEAVQRVSRATAHYGAVTGVDRSKRRTANKAARKARRNNRT